MINAGKYELQFLNTIREGINLRVEYFSMRDEEHLRVVVEEFRGLRDLSLFATKKICIVI